MDRKVEVLIDPADVAATAATVVDASWLYPPMNKAGVDVRARYRESHPPGSVFLDLEALSPPRPAVLADVEALAPPAPASLQAAFAGVGLGRDHPLVVTDQEGGVATAPFARLALLDAGFSEVRLLAGGTPAWRASGLPLTPDRPAVLAGPRCADGRRGGRLVGTDATRAAVAAGRAVVDARFVATNEGVLPPRFKDVAIPADVTLRPGEVVEETAAGLRFRAAAALRRIAASRGLADRGASVVTCHFGIGAAVVATALELAGIDGVQVDAESVLGWADASG